MINCIILKIFLLHRMVNIAIQPSPSLRLSLSLSQILSLDERLIIIKMRISPTWSTLYMIIRLLHVFIDNDYLTQSAMSTCTLAATICSKSDQWANSPQTETEELIAPVVYWNTYIHTYIHSSSILLPWMMGRLAKRRCSSRLAYHAYYILRYGHSILLCTCICAWIDRLNRKRGFISVELLAQKLPRAVSLSLSLD